MTTNQTPYTNQTAFDTMLAHLRTQQGRSLDSGGVACMYRGEDGKKCAVGALIPDEFYTPGMDGSYSLTYVMYTPGVFVLTRDVDPHLLLQMRSVHDAKRNWRGDKFVGEVEAAGVAMSYDLTYTPPEAS